MLELLVRIIPLDLTLIIRPTMFAIALILLGSKMYPKVKATSLLVSSLIVGIVIAILGFAMGQAIPTGTKYHTLTATIDVILGAILMLLAIIEIFSKKKQLKAYGEGQGRGIVKWLLVGAGLSLSSISSLIILFAG